MTTNEFSPAKLPLILSSTTQWDKWFFYIKDEARSLRVWQYLDQSKPELLLTRPNRPVYSDIKEGAVRFGDLSAIEQQEYQFIQGNYVADEKEYALNARNYARINTLINSSVNSNYWIYLRDAETPYQKLRVLKQRFAPSDRARELQVAAEYRLLLRAPKYQDTDKWLLNWERIYQEALSIDLPEVQKDRPSYDFLNAVKTLDAGFASTNLNTLLQGINPTSLLQLIDRFRDWRRITTSESKSASHSAFITQNEPPAEPPAAPQNKQKGPYKPTCLCGEKHWYAECYYVNPAGNPRPTSWRAETQERINQAMTNDPELAYKIEQSLARSAAYKQANDSQASSHSVGSFTASYSVATDYKLKNHWILDSGSDIHVTNTLRCFKKASNGREIDQIIAGGSSYPISAFGSLDITINTPAGERAMTLLNVAYVPGFMTNLVSLSLLVSKGVHWNTQTGSLYKDDKVLCYVNKLDGHWTLSKSALGCPTSTGHLNSVNTTSKDERPTITATKTQWHQIMGHPYDDSLQRLPEAAEGVKITSDEAIACEPCRLSKATQQVSRRPGQEEQVTRPFQRVSFDLIQMDEAYNGDQWISHFKCFYTSMNHVYTHSSKSETTDIVKEYVNLVYNRYNQAVTYMRLDGESSLGGNFDEFVKSRGITTERSAPYVPAQNGHAEKAGRSIITMARTMRIQAHLPSSLWPEIVRTAGYLLNRLPHRRSGWKTPFEAVQGKKPSLSHLHVYGCTAYSLIYGIPRKQKLEARAQIGYLIGYDSRNIYRVWNPVNGKVIRTRDVTFDENRLYHPDQVANLLLSEPEQPTPLRAFEMEDSEDEEDPDTITVLPRRQPTTIETVPASPPSPVAAKTTTIAPAMPLTPEMTPEPISQNALATLPQNRNMSDLNPANIIATRRVRKERHQAYITACENGSLSSYYSSFTTALADSQNPLKRHRDSMPPEPKYWRNLLTHPYKHEFIQAAQKEWNELIKRGTFQQITIQPDSDTKALPLLWVFKYKFDGDGYLEKFKARICVRGDLQESFQDNYAATLASRVFRALMAITAAYDLEIIQLDAVNAFLNSKIDHEVYIEYPEGFKQPGRILRLLLALYGLKRSPLLWHQELTTTLISLGLQEVAGVNCLLRNDLLLIFFYVDDIIILYHKQMETKVMEFLGKLQAKYHLRVLPKADWFLGIKITRNRANKRLFLSQASYIDKLAARFHVDVVKPPATPLPNETLKPSDGQASPQEIHAYQQRIGSINFAATITRPDIAFACSSLSQYLTNPSVKHAELADRVISYLASTRDWAIEYNGQENGTLQIYSDAAFADNTDRRSSQGYLFTLFGGPIDWKASKQASVTTSSTEAELYALSATTRESIWWKRMLNAIQFAIQETITVHCDNKQTIRLLEKPYPQLNTQLKHVDIHNHWLRQEVQNGTMSIKWLETALMKADGLTKSLSRQQHERFIAQLQLARLNTKDSIPIA